MPGRGRYDNVPVTTTDVPDGDGDTRPVRYFRRRWPPPPSTQPPLARHRVGSDDRIDLVSARYLGDPQGWWRICDEAAALDPDEVVAPDAEGSIVTIPVPGL